MCVGGVLYIVHVCAVCWFLEWRYQRIKYYVQKCLKILQKCAKCAEWVLLKLKWFGNNSVKWIDQIYILVTPTKWCFTYIVLRLFLCQYTRKRKCLRVKPDCVNQNRALSKVAHYGDCIYGITVLPFIIGKINKIYIRFYLCLWAFFRVWWRSRASIFAALLCVPFR